jgi:hypothetical protein
MFPPNEYSLMCQWIKQTETVGADLPDKPWSPHPCTAVISNHVRWVEVICAYCCIMIDDLCSSLSVSKGSVEVITEEIFYSKVYVPWGPQMLTDEHKSARKVIPLSFTLI